MNGTMRESTEESLVGEAKRGSLDAFTELVRRTQARVYSMIFRMTRNHEDADDLMQETFLSAYRALPKFDGRSSFSTWAYRIAMNMTLNHLKRKGREKGRTSLDENAALPESAGGDPPSPESESLRTELQGKIDGAIADLPAIYRAAFTLVALQGMSHGDAAAILGCSENTVSWRMHRSRKMLQERLKGEI
jgi:RNA polymerase sigma-70 factor (ECF subfamily)